MGILVQRRSFDHIQFAQATAEGFHDPEFKIPGLTISTNIVEQADQIWLVLTQQGAMVTKPEPILPDYEFVSFQP